MEKRKFFFFGVLIGLGALVAFFKSQPDGRLHLVFCDVGQGDAIYIKFPDGRDGLVDGGPNRAVLNCLGRHMAFWDRKIELVILTHPQADHLNGLLEVLERYQVDLFLAPPVGNETKGYGQLVELVKEKGIRVRNVYAGDIIKIRNPKSEIRNKSEIQNSKSQLPITTPNQSKLGSGQDYQLRHEVALNVLWPEREWLAARLQNESSVRTDNARVPYIITKDVLGAKTWHSDLNDFSLVFELSYGGFEALLTGDAEKEILEKAIREEQLKFYPTVKPKNQSPTVVSKGLEIFKVPHHGAARGVSAGLLEKLRPAAAAISVGKNNRYGHPNKKILEILRDYDITILRTDIEGEIEVVTDGEKFKVKKKKV